MVVAAGAEIVGLHRPGPGRIGAGTALVDSFIGPFTSIGDDCEVVDCEIEHSIVMDGSRSSTSRGSRTALIGRDAVVSRTDHARGRLRLMVGDHCQVDLE